MSKIFGILRLWLLLLAAPVLFSCTQQNIAGNTSVHKEDIKNLVYLKEDVLIPLPQSSCIKKDESLRQLVTFSFEGRKHTLQSVLIFKKDYLSLNYFSLSSLPLYRATYKDNIIKLEERAQNLPFPKPSQMLFDIMIAFDELCEIKASLPSMYTLVKADNRSYLYDDKNNPVYEIEYRRHEDKKLPVLIKNHIYSYTISLKYL